MRPPRRYTGTPGFENLCAPALARCIPQGCPETGNTSQCIDNRPESDYNAFFCSNFSGSNGDIEGRLAVGGSLHVSSWGTASKIACNATIPALLVGNAVYYHNGQIGGGQALYSPSAPYDVVGVGFSCSNSRFRASNNINQFFAPFCGTTGNCRDSYLYSFSQALAANSQNVQSVVVSGTTMTITLAGTSNVAEIANINGDTYFHAGSPAINTFQVSNPSALKPGALIILNIHGTNLQFTGGGNLLTNSGLSGSVIWNFPDATSITISSATPEGNFFAPCATINGQNGNINGRVFAFAFASTSSLEIHIGPLSNFCFGTSLGLPPQPVVPVIPSADLTAPVHCSTQSDCTFVSNDFNFVSCVGGFCACQATYSGLATEASKCACLSPNRVEFPYCLTPTQCLRTSDCASPKTCAITSGPIGTCS